MDGNPGKSESASTGERSARRIACADGLHNAREVFATLTEAPYGQVEISGMARSLSRRLVRNRSGKIHDEDSAAEVAPFSRLQQMHEPISKDEVIAIYDAVHVLRILSYDLYTREKREHLTQMPRQSASRQSNLASATTLNISCAPATKSLRQCPGGVLLQNLEIRSGVLARIPRPVRSPCLHRAVPGEGLQRKTTALCLGLSAAGGIRAIRSRPHGEALADVSQVQEAAV
jgi:hypothetical protein